MTTNPAEFVYALHTRNHHLLHGETGASHGWAGDCVAMEGAGMNLFEGLRNVRAGIFRDWLDEYQPVHSMGNRLIIGAGISYFPYYDRSIVHYYDGWGDDELKGVVSVPDGKSSVVIRTDYKQQEARIVILRHGWRGWRLRLRRWLNRIVRRYADIPICQVDCQNGWVTTLEDCRQFAEYHA